MTYTDLQKAQRLADEMKDLRRVIEHLNTFKSGIDDPIDFIVKYLKECRMVGNDHIRKQLAIGLLEDSKKILETTIQMKREEFDAL